MRVRRLGNIIGVGFLPAVFSAAPLSALAQTTPPPPAEAEAYAAQLQAGGQQVVAVGHTQATAGPDAGSSAAHAGAIEIGPEPPGDAHVGGSQTGSGGAKGSTFDTAGTGFDQLGRVALTPWFVLMAEDGTGRHSRAHAALLELVLNPGGNKVLDVRLLTSDSAADHSSSKSTAASSADGVVLILGDPANGQGLELWVLHSEASSEAGASGYLLNVNGNKLATTSDQLGAGLRQLCAAIQIPNALKLACVQASGGAAEAFQALLGDGGARGALVDVARAEGSGGAASAPPQVLGGEVAPPPAPAPAPAPTPPAVAGAELPRTGAVLGAVAGLLAALGLAIRARLCRMSD
ncbi:MAG: hypothetical protein HYU28_12035 [Actinobacteria bacterium]|nr:hypothetical protein [Actinomycetota bacterium]